MKIRWFGHSCFYIVSNSGTRMLTDPFAAKVGYQVPNVEADIVMVSHDHYDHNNIKAVKGNFQVLCSEGLSESADVRVKGISTYHDEEKGNKRGKNIIFNFAVDGMNICHLGDLGHIPDENQTREIGLVDILMIPVGGTFTIDAEKAFKTVELIKPKIIIPMHYNTTVLTFVLSNVENFTNKFSAERVLKPETIDLIVDDISTYEGKVIVMKYR